MSVDSRWGAGEAEASYDTLGPREETSLFGFFNVLLKYRNMIAIFMIAFAAWSAIGAVQMRRRYEARVAVTVEGSSTNTSIEALLGGVQQPRELQFFTELLRSPPFLRQIAKLRYTVPTGRGVISGPLDTFYGMTGNPDSHADAMTQILTDDIRIQSSPITGNLWIFVDTPYPQLSKQLATNLVNLLDSYSRKRRQDRAAAEREFIEGRVAEAQAQLRAAENEIVQFRTTNREFESPALAMIGLRLTRNVTMRQQLVTSLIQSYDAARLAEAKNISSISLLESPEVPNKPEPSQAVGSVFLGAITGLLIAIIVAFIRERLEETSAARTPAFDRYIELKRETAGDLRNPLGSFRRFMGRRENK